MLQPLMTYGRFYTHPKKKFVRGVVRGIPIKGKNYLDMGGQNWHKSALDTFILPNSKIQRLMSFSDPI